MRLPDAQRFLGFRRMRPGDEHPTAVRHSAGSSLCCFGAANRHRADRLSRTERVSSRGEHMMIRRMVVGALAAATLLAAACGGSSNSSGPVANPTATPSAIGTVSGTAVKGPVTGATVTAYAVANGAKGNAIGSATTDGQGRFTVTIGSYAGPVMMEMTGGSYTDEATGATMPMATGDVLRAVMPAVAAGATTSGLCLSPLTSMAQARAQAMPGGMTDANVTAANGAVGGYFMVGDILYTMPMDPLVQGSGAAATQDARNYGMAMAAMSQSAHTLGMPSSSGMVTAMMDDATDGVMNGMMGATQISMSGMGGMMGGAMMQPMTGTASLATAMTQFMTSAMNRSGVTATQMQPLVDHLASSNGTLR
jgi:hypothetical protein